MLRTRRKHSPGCYAQQQTAIQRVNQLASHIIQDINRRDTIRERGGKGTADVPPSLYDYEIPFQIDAQLNVIVPSHEGVSSILSYDDIMQSSEDSIKEFLRRWVTEPIDQYKMREYQLGVVKSMISGGKRFAASGKVASADKQCEELESDERLLASAYKTLTQTSYRSQLSSIEPLAMMVNAKLGYVKTSFQNVKELNGKRINKYLALAEERARAALNVKVRGIFQQAIIKAQKELQAFEEDNKSKPLGKGVKPDFIQLVNSYIAKHKKKMLVKDVYDCYWQELSSSDLLGEKVWQLAEEIEKEFEKDKDQFMVAAHTDEMAFFSRKRAEGEDEELEYSDSDSDSDSDSADETKRLLDSERNRPSYLGLNRDFPYDSKKEELAALNDKNDVAHRRKKSAGQGALPVGLSKITTTYYDSHNQAPEKQYSYYRLPSIPKVKVKHSRITQGVSSSVDDVRQQLTAAVNEKKTGGRYNLLTSTGMLGRYGETAIYELTQQAVHLHNKGCDDKKIELLTLGVNGYDGHFNPFYDEDTKNEKIVNNDMAILGIINKALSDHVVIRHRYKKFRQRKNIAEESFRNEYEKVSGWYSQFLGKISDHSNGNNFFSSYEPESESESESEQGQSSSGKKSITELMKDVRSSFNSCGLENLLTDDDSIQAVATRLLLDCYRRGHHEDKKYAMAIQILACLVDDDYFVGCKSGNERTAVVVNAVAFLRDVDHGFFGQQLRQSISVKMTDVMEQGSEYTLDAFSVDLNKMINQHALRSVAGESICQRDTSGPQALAREDRFFGRVWYKISHTTKCMPPEFTRLMNNGEKSTQSHSVIEKDLSEVLQSNKRMRDVQCRKPTTTKVKNKSATDLFISTCIREAKKARLNEKNQPENNGVEQEKVTDTNGLLNAALKLEIEEIRKKGKRAVLSIIKDARDGNKEKTVLITDSLDRAPLLSCTAGKRKAMADELAAIDTKTLVYNRIALSCAAGVVHLLESMVDVGEMNESQQDKAAQFKEIIIDSALHFSENLEEKINSISDWTAEDSKKDFARYYKYALVPFYKEMMSTLKPRSAVPGDAEIESIIDRASELATLGYTPPVRVSIARLKNKIQVRKKDESVADSEIIQSENGYSIDIQDPIIQLSQEQIEELNGIANYYDPKVGSLDLPLWFENLPCDDHKVIVGAFAKKVRDGNQKTAAVGSQLRDLIPFIRNGAVRQYFIRERDGWYRVGHPSGRIATPSMAQKDEELAWMDQYDFKMDSRGLEGIRNTTNVLYQEAAFAKSEVKKHYNEYGGIQLQDDEIDSQHLTLCSPWATDSALDWVARVTNYFSGAIKYFEAGGQKSLKDLHKEKTWFGKARKKDIKGTNLEKAAQFFIALCTGLGGLITGTVVTPFAGIYGLAIKTLSLGFTPLFFDGKDDSIDAFIPTYQGKSLFAKMREAFRPKKSVYSFLSSLFQDFQGFANWMLSPFQAYDRYKKGQLSFFPTVAYVVLELFVRALAIPLKITHYAAKITNLILQPVKNLLVFTTAMVMRLAVAVVSLPKFFIGVKNKFSKFLKGCAKYCKNFGKHQYLAVDKSLALQSRIACQQIMDNKKRNEQQIHVEPTINYNVAPSQMIEGGVGTHKLLKVKQAESVIKQFEEKCKESRSSSSSNENIQKQLSEVKPLIEKLKAALSGLNRHVDSIHTFKMLISDKNCSDRWVMHYADLVTVLNDVFLMAKTNLGQTAGNSHGSSSSNGDVTQPLLGGPGNFWNQIKNTIKSYVLLKVGCASCRNRGGHYFTKKLMNQLALYTGNEDAQLEITYSSILDDALLPLTGTAMERHTQGTRPKSNGALDRTDRHTKDAANCTVMGSPCDLKTMLDATKCIRNDSDDGKNQFMNHYGINSHIHSISGVNTGSNYGNSSAANNSTHQKPRRSSFKAKVVENKDSGKLDRVSANVKGSDIYHMTHAAYSTVQSFKKACSRHPQDTFEIQGKNKGLKFMILLSLLNSTDYVSKNKVSYSKSTDEIFEFFNGLSGEDKGKYCNIIFAVFKTLHQNNKTDEQLMLLRLVAGLYLKGNKNSSGNQLFSTLLYRCMTTKNNLEGASSRQSGSAKFPLTQRTTSRYRFSLAYSGSKSTESTDGLGMDNDEQKRLDDVVSNFNLDSRPVGGR